MNPADPETLEKVEHYQGPESNVDTFESVGQNNLLFFPIVHTTTKQNINYVIGCSSLKTK